MGIIGTIVGLIVGLLANPLTAWFAMFELGIPAAIAGGVVSLIAALILTAGREIKKTVERKLVRRIRSYD
jgi:ABC-type uncharacterized transport system permease subunit